MYLAKISRALASAGVATNNIIADRFSEPAFQIEGKCTLTTVYRAKGNEAAVVFALGCEAVPLATRSGRNRLFTAFTRTKGWLRITGMGRPFDKLKREIETALNLTPKMKFKMPDPQRIELIQRDLSEKDARAQRVRAELERLKEQFGISEDDLQTIVSERPSYDKR
jgi:superfamily I DNA and RNA helicase